MIIPLGDIHGRFEPLFRKLKEFDIRNCYILQVGDFGVGFERPAKELARLKFLNNTLKSKGIIMYVTRGNHDDPAYFLGDYNYTNLKLMPDNSIITLEGKKILLLGGAISIDRITRKNGLDYWTNEKFYLDRTLLSTFENIDIVCSHSSPKVVFPYWNKTDSMSEYAKQDFGLLHEVSLERLDLQEAYEILSLKNKIEYWFHGHFHCSNRSEHKNTIFISLAIDELYEIR